ncbi:putative T6SS immunity periplasmic lipoprotein [Morganella morganii]|uniref:putative T6SS immunity periplasmic lipoprotein n=1 Tax=Morganella morganii TaxID=582 RepID=UPI00320A8DCA
MHKLIIVPLVFLLGGCWHVNDPRPLIVNGDVSMSAGKLCVKTSNASDDEYITYINVFDFKAQKTIADMDYSDSPVKLDENKCLPAPDIQYQDNGKYAYTASTVLQKKQAKKINPHRRSIGVTFFIKDIDGEKQAIDALKI